MTVTLRSLTGVDLDSALDDVAALRIAVFRDWPYLYDGDPDYERRYLATDPGLPQAHGQTYVLPAGAFFDVAGGKITRITTFYNLADWVAQVSA